MRLSCEKGFYKFFPFFVGEIKLWQAKNESKLIKVKDYWTFESLANLPNYSFKGHSLAGLTATANYAGRPEDVLSKNNLTYNVKLGKITSRDDVKLQRLTYANGAYMTFASLPQAYALDEGLQQVTGFDLFIDVRLNTYKLERFNYEDI